MIPFFVVDRPMSLNIIKTFFSTRPGVPFGLMTHALTPASFRNLYADFPCDRNHCWLSSNKQQCDNQDLCDAGRRLRASAVKAVDCGIFAQGPALTYPALFHRYQQMNAHYGIMKDVFGDPAKTLISARRAIQAYKRRQRPFELVLVAHGSDKEQYVSSFQKLAAFGVGKLAIGGLLNRKVNSARYASARPLAEIGEILCAVRARFPNHWLFALGCYHPKRHRILEKHNVFGSDYKGWIFNYMHRLDILAQTHDTLLEKEHELRPQTRLLPRAIARKKLWERASLVRKSYATTKNVSQEHSRLKSKYRARLRKLLADLAQLDQALAQERTSLALTDSASDSYKSNATRFQRLLSQTDQEVRVAEVHRYLSEQILPRLACDA